MRHPQIAPREGLKGLIPGQPMMVGVFIHSTAHCDPNALVAVIEQALDQPADRRELVAAHLVQPRFNESVLNHHAGNGAPIKLVVHQPASLGQGSDNHSVDTTRQKDLRQSPLRHLRRVEIEKFQAETEFRRAISGALKVLPHRRLGVCLDFRHRPIAQERQALAGRFRMQGADVCHMRSHQRIRAVAHFLCQFLDLQSRRFANLRMIAQRQRHGRAPNARPFGDLLHPDEVRSWHRKTA